MRFVETLVRLGRVRAPGMIFGADATYEARHQPAARDVVDHRELFGDRQRIVEERQRAAEHRDLAVLRAARERACHDAGNGHQAIGVLVMLVDADAVPAEFIGIFDLVEIAVIELVADLRIVVGVRQRHPGGIVFLIVVGIERRIGHEMKKEEFHFPASTKRMSSSVHSSIFSTCGTCPHCSNTLSFEP